ncbi:LSM domain [Nakaseomyces glabratus]|nr:LSM domain [Nakaseomyces glabratus]
MFTSISSLYSTWSKVPRGEKNKMCRGKQSREYIYRAMAEESVSTQFLSNIIGKPVHVKLYSGMLYSGVLESIDGFMNVALSETREHYEHPNNNLLKKYASDVFLRGTQVMYISEA